MPSGIPDASGAWRYQQADAAIGGASQISATEALRSFADDLLESGDARLALERAFRWGYQDEDGNHAAGLQERVQELRQRRDRLLRQVDQPEFLDALTPELDRLDAIDAEAGEGVRSPDGDGQTPADRLLDRLEHGYTSEEAQDGLDALWSDLAHSSQARSGSSERRGRGQAGAGHGPMHGAKSASAERLLRMLFQGGSEAEGESAGAWRRDATEARAIEQAAFFDLDLLAELERVEAALSALDSVGSVAAIPDAVIEALRAGQMSDLGDWLSEWRGVVTTVFPAGAGPAADLPPEVVTAISRDLLKGLFRMAASPMRGEHRSLVTGTAGDPAETSRAWEPGRPFDLDLVATVSAAVRRGSAAAGSVRLLPEDFTVVDRASSVSVATVLAIDRSRSMGQSGAWTSAKKVALAMHELIRQAYRRDSLGLVAFSSDAESIDIENVPQMQWDRFEHGTHLQAALALARKMLRRNRSGTRQIVVITDGEPTLATIRGEQVFASPPTDEVLNATMTEVIRCTREGITINLIMVGAGAGGGFAEQVARVNRGRVFTATSETLGGYILRDYVSR